VYLLGDEGRHGRLSDLSSMRLGRHAVAEEAKRCKSVSQLWLGEPERQNVQGTIGLEEQPVERHHLDDRKRSLRLGKGDCACNTNEPRSAALVDLRTWPRV
jgi:hypothetical protein